jgi:hypothetical protein
MIINLAYLKVTGIARRRNSPIKPHAIIQVIDDDVNSRDRLLVSISVYWVGRVATGKNEPRMNTDFHGFPQILSVPTGDLFEL